MDNLDRTNVVQAALAKWTLNQQLTELGILSGSAGIDDYESFSKDFRESEGHSFFPVLISSDAYTLPFYSVGRTRRYDRQSIRRFGCSQI